MPTGTYRYFAADVRKILGDHAGERLLRAGDLADRFHISSKTVLAWGKRGLIPSIELPSGHKRFPERPVLAAIREYGAAHQAEPEMA
jgi:hypothetical protein